ASMLQASNFVEAVQNTQGTYIACLEEIAYRKGWITAGQVIELAKPLMKTGYGKYLVDIVEDIESKKALEEVAATAN
ncbi:glucose-1-phosphate thymidylyltransferase, partial [Clostridium perfringens]|nr:glucose-1-phosphate thymidylyltransferase [Clostridium perfringens]MDM0953499.1 glucose-1-phosphate thymidylyltransferase [Clostridium perfringens]